MRFREANDCGHCWIRCLAWPDRSKWNVRFESCLDQIAPDLSAVGRIQQWRLTLSGGVEIGGLANERWLTNGAEVDVDQIVRIYWLYIQL